MAPVVLRPGVVLGRYVIEELLGEGGMGAVYRARDTEHARSVALKVVRPDEGRPAAEERQARQRLHREARAAAALEHPNAVRIYDVGEADGVAFVAMELVTGRTLRTFVGARVPLATQLAWLVAVARALSAAHLRGVVHRDVKPDNVMIGEAGEVKVLDFGIARRVPDSEIRELTTITEEGALLGTPRYMAPEQVRGERVDARADQFGWGVTAFELLAGVSPWAGDRTLLSLAVRIVASPPPSLRALAPWLPAELEEVVLRALEKAPDDRFPTMAAVALALEPIAAALGPEGARAPAASVTAPSEKSGTRVSSERVVLTNTGFEVRGDLVISVMNGRPQSDDEHAVVVDVLRRAPEGRLKRLLTLTHGGAPSTMQRKNFNEALRGHQLRTAIVSDKVSVRGVATALSWYNRQIRAFWLSELDEAFAFLGIDESERPEVRASLESLERDVERASRRRRER